MFIQDSGFVKGGGKGCLKSRVSTTMLQVRQCCTINEHQENKQYISHRPAQALSNVVWAKCGVRIILFLIVFVWLNLLVFIMEYFSSIQHSCRWTY